jgi:hypothetical protein
MQKNSNELIIIITTTIIIHHLMVLVTCLSIWVVGAVVQAMAMGMVMAADLAVLEDQATRLQ